MARTNASCIVIPFGLAFLLMGGGVFWFMLSEFRAIYDTQSWEEVLIDLRSVDVHFPDKPPSSNKHDIYELVVEYQYDYEGKQYTSTKFRLQEYRSDTYESMALARRDLRASGDGLVAHVNPNDPTQAILQHDSLWFGLILLMPLLFMLIGVFLVLACFPIWGWLGSGSGRDKPARLGSSDTDYPQRNDNRGGLHDE